MPPTWPGWGVRTLLRPPEDLGQVQESGRRALLDGFWVNLLNPKVVIFFLAFLPQFVSDAAAWPVGLQVAVYALVIVGIGLVNSAAWVLGVAALASHTLGRRTAWVRRWVVGSLYLVLAVVAAVANVG